MRCPYCATVNRDDVTFCIDCGESFDEQAAADARPRARIEEARGAERRVGLRRPRSWELLLGAVILAAVLGFSAYTGWQDMIQNQLGRAYRQAEEYESKGMKVEAASFYAQAVGYRDAQDRLDKLQPLVEQLKSSYRQGVAAAEEGRWWDAARQMRVAAGIQVSYRDVFTRLGEARLKSGPLFYRQGGPGGEDGVWWAFSDGSQPQGIPYSDKYTVVHALSTDGTWAVYSLYQRFGDGGTRVPYLLNLKTGQITALSVPLTWTNPAAIRVLFRNNGAGFYISFEDRYVYYDLTRALGVPPDQPLPPLASYFSAEIPAAIDPAEGLMLLIRPTRDQKTGNARTRILMAEPTSQPYRWQVAQEDGTVQAAAFDPTGRYLLYAVRSLPRRDEAGDDIHVDTLVAVDLGDNSGREGTRRYEVASVLSMRNGDEIGWIEGAFLAGSPPRVVVVRAEGARQSLFSANLDGSGQQPLGEQDTSAAGGAGWLAGIRLGPDGRLLGATSLTGGQGPRLSLMSLDDGVRLALPPGAVAPDWLRFTPGERYVLYLRFEDNGRRTLGLRSVRLPQTATDAAGETGLREAFADFAQLERRLAITRDGHRLLVVRDGDSGEQGIYAVNLDGTDPLLVVPGATEIWTTESTAEPLFDPNPPFRAFRP